MASEILNAQTTVDDEDQAKALARGAVGARLAACAHIDESFTATRSIWTSASWSPVTAPLR